MARAPSRKFKVEPVEHTRIFQMRLAANDERDAALNSLADRYQRAKRTLYGRGKASGQPFDTFKTALCQEFGLPARLFNALKKDLDASVRSAQEKARHDIAQVEDKLEAIDRSTAKLNEKLADKDLARTRRKRLLFGLHRKREGKQRQSSRLSALHRRADAAFPSLCFGSRGLFNAQHHLAENRYASHAEWLKDWYAARSDQFLVVGSNDEPGGNKTCRASVNEGGSVTLRLFLGEAQGYLTLENLVLPHGHAEWLEALAAADAEFAVSQAWQKESARLSAEAKAAGASKEALGSLRKERLRLRKAQPKLGHALAYRFLRDGYGWRIMVTVTKSIARVEADFARGCIGLDLNEHHVARTRVAADGTLVDSRDIPLVTRGKTTGQRMALLHEVATQLVREAKAARLPLVIETLDFGAKKRRLREVGCSAAARRLSSFAYARFAAVLESHARLHGVALVEVNPAYTSVIGAALHAVPHGLTVHGAAAMAIARRALMVEETLPERMRVWVPGRAPRAMERPNCLRRKASVEPLWPGWRELSKAVRAARAVAKGEQRTGSQIRQARRRAATLAADVAFLATL